MMEDAINDLHKTIRDLFSGSLSVATYGLERLMYGIHCAFILDLGTHLVDITLLEANIMLVCKTSSLKSCRKHLAKNVITAHNSGLAIPEDTP